MALGAVLGVTGYRRLGRLARAIRPGGGRGSGRGAAGRPEPPAAASRFARDVRDGMELYLSRHARPAAPNLEAQQARAQRG
jgi:hypothetical protein